MTALHLFDLTEKSAPVRGCKQGVGKIGARPGVGADVVAVRATLLNGGCNIGKAVLLPGRSGDASEHVAAGRSGTAGDIKAPALSCGSAALFDGGAAISTVDDRRGRR